MWVPNRRLAFSSHRVREPHTSEPGGNVANAAECIGSTADLCQARIATARRRRVDLQGADIAHRTLCR